MQCCAVLVIYVQLSKPAALCLGLQQGVSLLRNESANPCVRLDKPWMAFRGVGEQLVVHLHEHQAVLACLTVFTLAGLAYKDPH